MWGPGWLGPLQRAPALPGALQVRPEGWIPPGAIWGNSPPRVFSSPAGVTAVPVPQGEVPGDGLPGPQSRDEVVRPHPPAERYRRHCRPPASPLHPPGWGAGTWHGIGPTPSPQNPEGRSGPRSPPAALSLPFPSHHLRAPRVPPHVPHPSSFQPAAPAPSTPHPYAAAATRSSSPPSSPAWAPCWPRQCSAPWGTGAARGRAWGGGTRSRGALGEHPLLGPVSKEMELQRCFEDLKSLFFLLKSGVCHSLARRKGPSAVVGAGGPAEPRGPRLTPLLVSPCSTEAWRSLCRRDSGTGTFSHRSYRTHHIPPALPQPLPPGCRCSPPGLGCFAPRPPGPCPAE